MQVPIRTLIISRIIQYWIISFERRFLEFQHFEFEIPFKHPVAPSGSCCVEHQCRNRGSEKQRAPLHFVALSLQPDIFERRPAILHSSQLKDMIYHGFMVYIRTFIDRHCDTVYG